MDTYTRYCLLKKMASKPINITNMKDAVLDGTVSGKFNGDKTVFEFPTLTYLGASGKIHCWTICVRLIHAERYIPITDELLELKVLPIDYKAEITVVAQQAGGKIRDTTPTYVSVGKNLGKKNATSAITQAIRDALGLYNKQKKRVGEQSPKPLVKSETKDESKVYTLMPSPMLVKKIGDSREATLTGNDFESGVTVQRKYNGVHYVVFVDGSSVAVGYSRTGTIYPGQTHILAEMKSMIEVAPRVGPGKYGITEKTATAYEGHQSPYFAGELYRHGKSLNWISGQARREDDDEQLEYHIFDVFFPAAKAAGHDMQSRHRQAYLNDFFKSSVAHPHIVRVENFTAASKEEIDEYAKQFVAEGYEGAIARKDAAGYRYSTNNYHSSNVVKIKPIYDAEFPVVGFTQGTRGKDVGALVWICEVPNPVDPNDRTFNVVPKDMTYETRYKLFKCLGDVVSEGQSRFDRDIKGLPLTVAFPELSAKTGKPLQAKSVIFRTYESGPEHDPVRKVLADCSA